MIDIQITEKKFWDNNVEGYVFLIKDGLEPLCEKTDFEKLEKDFYPNLKDILKKHKFTGKKGESFVLTATKDKKLVQFIFIGIGKLADKWNIELETLRRAVGNIVHVLKKLEVRDAALFVPDEKPFGLIKSRLVRQMIITSHMADYEFDTYKSDKKPEWKGTLFFAL